MSFNSKLLLCLSVFLFGANFLYTAENKEISEDPIFEIFNIDKRRETHGSDFFKFDYYKAIDDFIKSKKDVNIKNSSGQTLLMKAIEVNTDLGSMINNQTNIMKLCAPEFQQLFNDRILTMEETRDNLLKTIKLLLENGASLKIKDSKRKTAIGYLKIPSKIIRGERTTGRTAGYFDQKTSNYVKQELKIRKEREKETKNVLEGKLIPELANIVCDYEC